MAIGMLSLAAVFPVVIAQQREAVDVTTGSLAGSAATDFLSRSELLGLNVIARDIYFGSKSPQNILIPPNPLIRCPDQIVSTGLWEADWFWDDSNLDLSDVATEWQLNDQNLSNLSTGEISFTLVPMRAMVEAIVELYETEQNAAGNAITYAQALYETSDVCGILSNREWVELGWKAGQTWSNAYPEPTVGDSFPGNSGSNNWEYVLPTSARVSPQPFAGAVSDPDRPRLNQPEFIWDFVMRRTDDGGVEAAMFVRRLDPRIPIPAGETLSQVLTGQTSEDLVYPISFNLNQARPARTGKRDGNHVYSHIAAIAAVHDAEAQVSASGVPDRARLRLTEDLGGLEPPVWPGRGAGVGFEQIVRFAARPGQKLVDNTGVVRTVTEVVSITNNEAIVRVSPAFPATADLARAGGSLNNLQDDERGTVLQQVLFTADIPVNVFVERIY